MYGKVINGELIKAPYYMKKDEKEIFGYNLDVNINMLREDGWKLVVETPQPENMIAPVKSYVEDGDRITAVWSETYVEPVLTYAEKRAAEYPSPYSSSRKREEEYFSRRKKRSYESSGSKSSSS